MWFYFRLQLKKLEVEVDSILANRAKSPWLDTGYALLSYVLACKFIGMAS